MKILLICNTDGALFVFRKPIIDAALANGHAVVGISGQSNYIDRLRALGMRMHVRDFARHSVGLLDNFRLALSLWRTLRAEQPDVVHGFTHKPAIYGTIAAWLAGCPNILVTITGLGTLFIRNDLRSRILRRLLLWQYRFALRHANCVFFQNPDDLEQFVREGVVQTARAMLTHGSALDLEAFPYPSDEECRDARQTVARELKQDLTGATVVVFPARGVREKGFFEYYEAARILHQLAPGRYVFLHLGLIDQASSGVISADGVHDYAKACGVHYLGFKDDIDRYMRGCDVVALPSYREGTPRSLLEALALGKCIVTTDTPGCRETVLHGWNGWLCAVGSTQSLAAALLRADSAFNATARPRSRSLCEARYDARWLVDLTLRKYAE